MCYRFPMQPISLKTLLAGIIDAPVPDIEIKGLSLSSKETKPGDLFFAYQGCKSDGRQFIQDALDQGAVAVLCEDAGDSSQHDGIVFVENLRPIIGLIAARFYDHPSKKMTVIGVTGTNGKSSVVHLLTQALEKLGRKAAMLGTLGYGRLKQLNKLSRTTTDPIQNQAILAELLAQGVEAVTIEVSSHALDQARIAGVEFDYAVFTNLTRDHLDYHHNMQSYAHTKRLLFKLPNLKAAILNAEDSYGKAWIDELDDVLPVCSYSTKTLHPQANVSAKTTALDMNGIHARIETPWGEGDLDSGLLGQFNLSNLLAVMATLSMLDIPLSQILAVMASLSSTPGRMETLGGDDQALVIIDYAHTPDALAQALKALAPYCRGRLICVFGCGGNRDRGKRAEMALAAENYADSIIVTDDNPRDEPSQKIIEDILQGFKTVSKVQVQADREKAIEQALVLAKPGDMVLIAGKGHEKHQEVKGEFHPFDEREIVQKWLNGFPLSQE